MPYKDEEQAREAARLRMQRIRKGEHQGEHKQGEQGITGQGEHTLLSRPNGADYDPTEKLYNNPHYVDGTPRYLGPMTDGQVLDRLTVAA